jgi:hypothetical protein
MSKKDTFVVTDRSNSYSVPKGNNSTLPQGIPYYSYNILEHKLTALFGPFSIALFKIYYNG